MALSTNPEIKALWTEYFQIMRDAPADATDRMQRVYSQIEKLQLAQASRRTTQRMVAAAEESIERVVTSRA